MKIAFMFPGQGAQTVGMGKDIYEAYPEAKRIYDIATELTKKDIAKLCFEGPEEELNKTENTQIAILVTSLAMLEVIKQQGIKADICTGLSLGEYVALVYGGYLTIEDAIGLIQKRGYYMGNKIPQEEYAMAAVIGLESSEIEKICGAIEGFVVPANYNYSGQTVISGNRETVEKAMQVLKEKGAKKVIELKTSGPFHTKKLEEAKQCFLPELEKAKFLEGKIPVIKNIDGTVYTKADQLPEILANHIISPVRFDKAIQLMKEQGVDTFIEIGPGKALSGFVKKELQEVAIYNVCDIPSLEKVLELN